MSTTKTPWKTVTTSPNELGESPFWHPQEQMLYWLDIPGKQLLRTDTVGGPVETWDMPEEPGCMAPAASGGWVMALRHGIFRAHQWGGELQRIATLDYDTTQMRANDGKCDALGRFWVGTIDEPKQSMNAALYMVDCRDGRTPLIERKAGDALTANGLAWSPDGHTLYWSDTPRHVVHAWDFDPTSATMTAHRHFVQLPGKPDGWQFDPSAANGGYPGRPDGAAVDVQGNYYAAMFEGRRVCKFSPDGRLLAEIETPAQCPTMPCFGGADLKTLFITTARHGRSAAELAALPLSGCVFSMPVDVAGLPVNLFVD